MSAAPSLEVFPLTLDRWPDLVDLFQRPGAAIPGRCWCVYFRQRGVGEPAANRQKLHGIVAEGEVPGLLGYEASTAIGWISLGPRDGYPALQRSPVMRTRPPGESSTTWIVVCFFVDRRGRRRGLAEAMLREGIIHAVKSGATILDAYPVDKPSRSDNESVFVGTRRMFERAGFTQVMKLSPTRVMMRRILVPS